MKTAPSLLDILTDNIVEGLMPVEEARGIVLRREYYRRQALKKHGPVGCQQKLKDIEAEAIKEALDKFHWNRKRTAEALGISYSHLRTRIVKYRLDEVSDDAASRVVPEVSDLSENTGMDEGRREEE